jgi:hypothetical protein
MGGRNQALCKRRDWLEVPPAKVPAPEFFDALSDIDAPAGGWSKRSSDPHYAELPCYVPLVDDDGLDPFVVEIECN